jgi:hypothetical protein
MVYQKFEITDFYSKKIFGIGERAGNKKMKQNRAFKFATMEGALLGYVRQARDRNLPLTREIINTKAKEFVEKLGNEPCFRNRFTNVNHTYYSRFW